MTVETVRDQPPEKRLVAELEVVGEAAQLALGARLADLLRGRSALISLSGDLGAGKTTLVRGLIRRLGHQGPVRSPTYTLVEPYDGIEPAVVHLDLYRLSDPEELEYLGLRDLLERRGLMLVEWPDRGSGVLPPADIELLIEHCDDRRRIRVSASPEWASLLAALSAQGLAGDGERG
jgi:tRNA threonylcarbamoyladenosine biosynthesis protein TsaE